MAKIYLNNSYFTVNTFNRNTSFNGDGVTSYAYVNLGGDTSGLHTLGNTEITSLLIKKDDGTTIYDAGEISAHISTIDESLTEDRMNVNVNLQFNTSVGE